ncbi:solute carrier family 25 member 43 [Anolis sagrei]|uniref:solute carrier family 25 member 43 n=1 Tax=Anolis sagrei TaxID=38937 RepID=UPI00295B3E73|nr:solute carrier family 25 member 43 [Anolis sagrei ordinatus]
MATWRREGRLTGAQAAWCAGLAGAAGQSASAPLETLCALGQARAGFPRGPGGLREGARRLVRAEGKAALWKGNLAALLRLLPAAAAQLAAQRRFVMLFVDEAGHISHWGSIAAGGMAGVVAAVATYPAEVIQTRLIMQNRLQPSYKGVLHALCTICHQEGVTALYRGVSLSVLGAIPFSLGSFLVYTHLDRIWGEPSLGFTPLQNFTNGCLAAAVAQTFSFPFETIKRKMQAQSPCLPDNGGVDVHFSGLMDCFKQTVKTKGWLALWNGLTANLLRIVPYFGVMFSTFEFCRRICLYRNGYIDSPLSNQLTPGVDQSLRPKELREFKLLGRRNV